MDANVWLYCIYYIAIKIYISAVASSSDTDYRHTLNTFTLHFYFRTLCPDENINI